MRFLTFLIAFFTCSVLFSQEIYKPVTGDLLFQDIDCGDFCDAIEKVTTAVDGKSFSHVGILSVEEDKVFVFEAIGRGVVKTPFDSFLIRSVTNNNKPKVYVGRFKEFYKYIIPQAVKKCQSLLGSKYDDEFDISNNKYYCSELVYFAFTDTSGKPIFELNPMTYKDPDTHSFFPAWITYFKNLGVEIPEGKPGINPGGISRSDKIQIIYRYY